MNIFFKTSMWIGIVFSILFIALGLLMFFLPLITIEIISIIIEALLMSLGILTIVNYVRAESVHKASNYGFIYGIMCILLSLFLIANPNIAISIVPISMGIWMVLGSLIRMQFCFSLKSDKITFLYLIGTLIMFTCGIAVLANPFNTAILVVKALGMLIMIYSVIDLVETVSLKRFLDKI